MSMSDERTMGAFRTGPAFSGNPYEEFVTFLYTLDTFPTRGLLYMTG